MPDAPVIEYADYRARFDEDALTVAEALPHEPWCPRNDPDDLFDQCFDTRYETAVTAVNALRALGRLEGPPL